MDADTLEQIFFGFVHAGRTEDYASRQPYDFEAGGTGLDLLRTKRFSEQYGFEVRATSKPDSGSRFDLVFPSSVCCEPEDAS